MNSEWRRSAILGEDRRYSDAGCYLKAVPFWQRRWDWLFSQFDRTILPYRAAKALNAWLGLTSFRLNFQQFKKLELHYLFALKTGSDPQNLCNNCQIGPEGAFHY
jgi:hypothetical protein